ncbi:MAG: hypothetical protein JNL94_19450, partial [Planctomycetes bacterium]|nr:hypothetical protein [Planctomycetota bacterium]
MSRRLWISLCSLVGAMALTQAAPPRPYAEVRADAEAAFARGAYADARDLYLGVDLPALVAADARWVRFRRADATWRAAASSENPDTTDIDEGVEQLEALLRETERPEDKDTTYAEIQESVGDFHWQVRRYENWSEANAHYTEALDVWAGSSDLGTARRRYLGLVWRMAEPRWADQWFEYGYYSGNWLGLDVLENALRVATDANDRARVHFLVGQTLAATGDAPRRARAIEHYEDSLAAGKESPWYDDALYRLACLICDSGVPELDAVGRWTMRMDYPRALELYRRFAREFRAGESRWFDDVENRIATITSPTLYLSTPSQFVPGSKLRFDLSWRNVGRIELALYPTDLTRDVVVSEELPSTSFVQSIDVTKLEPVAVWTHDTNDDGKHVPGAATLYVPQTPAPGAYVLEAKGAGLNARDLVLISDAALTTHSLGPDTLAWFCDASNGKPIADAKLVLWQR